MAASRNVGQWLAQDDRLVSGECRLARAGSQWSLPRILRPPIRHGGWNGVRLLIAGAGGLVGRAVLEHCTRECDQIARLDHASLDITDEDQVNATFERERPDVVINCAAWTDVD